jgi:hypothetical protein
MAVMGSFVNILPWHYSWVFPETDIIACACVGGYPSNGASFAFVRVMGFPRNWILSEYDIDCII